MVRQAGEERGRRPGGERGRRVSQSATDTKTTKQRKRDKLAGGNFTRGETRHRRGKNKPRGLTGELQNFLP